MGIATIILVLAGIILAVIVLKMIVGAAKTAVKIALVVLAIYLVFTFISNKDTPTGATVDEPSAITQESNAPPTGEGSQYPHDYTEPNGQGSPGPA